MTLEVKFIFLEIRKYQAYFLYRQIFDTTFSIMKQIILLILNQKLVLKSSDKYKFKCKIYI